MTQSLPERIDLGLISYPFPWKSMMAQAGRVVDVQSLKREHFVDRFRCALQNVTLLVSRLASRVVGETRMAIFCHVLGSQAENNSGGIYSMRMVFAALFAFLKSLGMEFAKKDAAVFGVHLGLFFRVPRPLFVASPLRMQL